MRKPCRLLLIRHGDITANGDRSGMRLIGWTDTALSERGRAEVAQLARRLSGVAITAVYASPLARALETARAIAREPVRPLVIEPALREIGCGDAEGRRIEDVRRSFPDLWSRHERQDDEEFRWPAGESYREFRDRTLAAVTRILHHHPGDRVAVVTHAGVITQLLNHLHGLPAARWSSFRAGNASLTVVDLGPRSRQLLSFDDREHLRP
jgi:alpha-ribazole phosphatase/probable phosphoglycerate mutase